MSTVPQSATFPMTPFILDSYFIPSVTTFHLFAALSPLMANSLCWLSIFVICHMDLSLGNNEAAQLHILCIKGTRDAQWSNTNKLEEVMWLSQIMIHICYLCPSLWGVKLVLHAITQLLYLGNWNRNHGIGGLSFYWTVVTEIYAHWNCKARTSYIRICT